MATMQDNGVASENSTMAISAHCKLYTWYVDREAISVSHILLAFMSLCYCDFIVFYLSSDESATYKHIFHGDISIVMVPMWVL